MPATTQTTEKEDIAAAIKVIERCKANDQHAVPLRAVTSKLLPNALALLFDRGLVELGGFDHAFIGADFERPTERDNDGKIIATQRINTRKVEVGTTMSFMKPGRSKRKPVRAIIEEDSKIEDERLMFYIRVTDKGLAEAA